MVKFNRRGQFVGLGLLAVASFALAGASISGSISQAPPPVSDKVASYVASPPPPPTAKVINLPATKRPTLAASLGLLADPAREWRLTVLGDSTGNDTNEWTFRLAEQLSSIYDRPVVMHRWLDGAAYSKEVTIGAGTNAPIHIWNGSVPGSTAVYAQKHLKEMLRKDSDLLIMNYGHNYTGTWNAETATLRTVSMVDELVGPKAMLFMLQNPQRPETSKSVAVTDLIRGMVTRAKYEYVDVYKAFKDSGKPASLMLDNIHPNPAGSQVWADAVAAKLSL